MLLLILLHEIHKKWENLHDCNHYSKIMNSWKLLNVMVFIGNMSEPIICYHFAFLKDMNKQFMGWSV